MIQIWQVDVLDADSECPFAEEYRFTTSDAADAFIDSLKDQAVGISGPTPLDVYEAADDVRRRQS